VPCDYIEADAREIDKILQGAAKTLDFSQPVAVSLLMILMLIPDEDDPYGIAARLMNAVPSGSYMVISHPASDVDTGQIAEAYERLNERMGATQATLRSRQEIARFFDGLEMVEPGLVQLPEWRPGPGVAPNGPGTPAYCGVGRKP
jgi:S-adenosyl methyltransferase